MRRIVLSICLLAGGCLDDGDGGVVRPPDDPDYPPTNPPTNPPTGRCGEIKCSPKTPEGLEFIGVAPISGDFPNGALSGINHHIAVGGLHEVTLKRGNTTEEFTLPYEALSDNEAKLVVVQTDGPQVILRGLGGTAYLRLVDPANDDLYDRGAYASSHFQRAVPVGTEEFITSASLFESASGFAFAPGHRVIGVAYLNNFSPPNRLVDTTATVTLAGATQLDWNQIDIPAATVGTHEVAIEVGGMAATMEIEVTNQVDAVSQLASFGTIVCFGAHRADAFISGLAWTYDVNGVPTPTESFLGPNCYSNSTTVAQRVTAHAGGKSLTITVPGGTPQLTRERIAEMVSERQAALARLDLLAE